jgi:hypothetical protein
MTDNELLEYNKIKLYARKYSYKYGYAIAELVLNDIIDMSLTNEIDIKNFYIKVRHRIINKDLE